MTTDWLFILLLRHPGIDILDLKDVFQRYWIPILDAQPPEILPSLRKHPNIGNVDILPSQY